MNRRLPRSHSVIAFLLLVVFVAPLRAEDDPAKDEPVAIAPIWRDQDRLEKRLTEACILVEELCGAKFKQRPGLRITTAEEMAAILIKEFEAFPEEVLAEDEREPAARLLSRLALAKYEPATRTIHVLPETVALLQELDPEKEHEPLGERHARVVLVHEATHALDFERFEWDALRKTRKTQDGHHALNAIVEGHAQWITARAAKRWELETVFERVTALSVGSPGEVSSTMAAVLSVFRFAYVQGHRFMDAIHEAKGDEGIAQALRAPPATSREIEHPEFWLDPPDSTGDPDLVKIIDAFLPLVGDEGFSVRRTQLLEAAARSQIGRIPKEHRKDFLRGYQDGRVLIATIPGESVQVVALAALFESPADAVSFVKLERISTEATAKRMGDRVETRAFEEGAGPGGKYPGHFLHRVVQSPMGATEVQAQVFSTGRLALQLLIVGVPAFDRAVQDEVLAYAHAFAEDPQAALELEKPRSRKFTRKNREITIHVKGPGGVAVHGASVGIAQKTERGENVLHGQLEAGSVEVTVARGPVRIDIWGAVDADGKRLPYAPKLGTELPAEQLEVTITLEPGVAIRGTVVGADGKPAAGITIEAHPAEQGDPRFAPPGDAHGSAVSTEGGAFKIPSLGPIEYELRTMRGKEPASAGVTRARGGQDGITITLTPTSDVRLTVLDPQGKPVAYAEITSRHHSLDAPRMWLTERTDRNGVVLLRGFNPNLLYDLEIEPPRTSEDLAATKRRDWRPADGEIRLEKGWTLRGRVVDKEGKSTSAAVTRKTHNGTHTIYAGSDGLFRLGGLAAGPVKVAARPRKPHSRFGSEPEFEWITVQPTAEPITLPLQHVEPVAALTIRVRDPDGRPIPWARLRVEEVDEGDNPRRSRGGSMRGGEAVFDLPKGRFAVVVWAAGRSEREPLDLAPARRTGLGKQDTLVEITLTKGKRIEGLVVDGEGSPVSGASVRALQVQRHSMFAGSGSTHGTAQTDSDGRFRLLGLGDGPYRVRVKPPSPLVETESTEVESGTLDLRIAVTKGMSVTVQDWAGRPVAGARVTVTRTTQRGQGSWSYDRVLEQKTDARGIVKMRKFSADDDLELRVDSPRGRSDLLRLRIKGWKATPQTLTLERGFTVSGRVTGAEGPVKEAVIELDWEGGREEYAAITDAGGRFRTSGIPYGPVRVRAARDEDDPRAEGQFSDWVDASPEHPTVDLELGAKPTDVVLVLAGARRGLQGMVQREGAESGSGRRPIVFGENGQAKLTGLLPGRYTVWVPRAGKGRCVYLTGLDLSSKQVELSTSEARSIRFTATVPKGSRYVECHALGPLSTPHTAQRQEDGSYATEPLPPGPWRVKAKARAPDAWVHAEGRADWDNAPALVLKPR